MRQELLKYIESLGLKSEEARTTAIDMLTPVKDYRKLPSDKRLTARMAYLVAESMSVHRLRAPTDDEMLALMKQTKLSSAKLQNLCRANTMNVTQFPQNPFLTPICALIGATLQKAFRANDTAAATALVNTLEEYGIFPSGTIQHDMSLANLKGYLKAVLAPYERMEQISSNMQTSLLAQQGSLPSPGSLPNQSALAFQAAKAKSMLKQDYASILGTIYYDDFVEAPLEILSCFINENDLFCTPLFRAYFNGAATLSPMAARDVKRTYSFDDCDSFDDGLDIDDMEDVETIKNVFLYGDDEVPIGDCYTTLSSFGGRPLYTALNIPRQHIEYLREHGVPEQTARDFAVAIATLRATGLSRIYARGCDFEIPDDTPQPPADAVPRAEYDALATRLAEAEKRIRELNAACKEERHNVQVAQKAAEKAAEELTDAEELIGVYEQMLFADEDADGRNAEDCESGQQEPEPYDGNMNIVLFGGFDSFQRRIKQLFPNIRVISPAHGGPLNLNPISNADVVFIQPNRCGHTSYYALRNAVDRYHVPYYHLRNAGHVPCAQFMRETIAQLEAGKEKLRA